MSIQTIEHGRSAARGRAACRRRSAGAVAVEYAFLLVVVAMPVMTGVAAAGLQLLNNYGTMRNTILHAGP